jgi:Sporulation and spore germination
MSGKRVAVVASGAVIIVLGIVSASAARAIAVDRAVVHIFAPRGGPGANCARVYGLKRTVAKPAVLTGAIRALVAGPTASERRRGYSGWFSSKTANKVRAVHVRHGVAYVDFYDFRRVIPNASSSCGSALLLAQLNKTATQFPNVRRAIYSFNGNRRTFYQWLQRDSPEIRE